MNRGSSSITCGTDCSVTRLARYGRRPTKLNRVRQYAAPTANAVAMTAAVSAAAMLLASPLISGTVLHICT